LTRAAHPRASWLSRPYGRRSRLPSVLTALYGSGAHVRRRLCRIDRHRNSDIHNDSTVVHKTAGAVHMIGSSNAPLSRRRPVGGGRLMIGCRPRWAGPESGWVRRASRRVHWASGCVGGSAKSSRTGLAAGRVTHIRGKRRLGEAMSEGMSAARLDGSDGREPSGCDKANEQTPVLTLSARPRTLDWLFRPCL